MQAPGQSKPATWCEKMHGMYMQATAKLWHQHAVTHFEKHADGIFLLVSTHALADW